ncbi:MAG TPA: ubiquinone/menaquinone biosynthesis methyltransferase [Gemmatimonadaceae bacterium]
MSEPTRPPPPPAPDTGRAAPRPRLEEMDIDAMLRDPERKPLLVTPMFDLVAPRYDQFTRRFSFGMDRRWKARLVRSVVRDAPRGGRVIDMACGTGDLAFAVAAARADLHVTGVDASSEMLRRAEERRHRLGAHNVSLVAGDLGRLGLPNASADVVTAGYAVRNAPSWEGAVGELARVLRPEGRLYTLDFFLPGNRIWRGVLLRYLRLAGRLVGWWWHREPMAYGYIERSIVHFTSVAGFTTALQRNGLEVTSVQRFLGGGIAIHEATRRPV